jgi:hypothetical protein
VSLRRRALRLATVATTLVFGLSAAHGNLHDVERPGSGPALHTVACDEALAEPECPVCFGKAPSRPLHRGPVDATPHFAGLGLRHLHTPEAAPRLWNRATRPEAARAPPHAS